MGILNNAFNFLAKGPTPEQPAQQDLGWNGMKGSVPGAYLPWDLKSVSQAVNDLKTWRDAQAIWTAEEMPRTYPLQNLYKDVRNDLRVTSQLNNRIGKTQIATFELKGKNGETNNEATKTLMKTPVYYKLVKAILMAKWYGQSMGELNWKLNKRGDLILDFKPIPRTNFVPIEGLFYTDYTEDSTIPYRDLEEFGNTILEFLGEDDEDEFRFGEFNKLVPFVLFKKFCISCWSELCELEGIPPRVLKTNTQDPAQKARAVEMMKNMAAAAWAVIDTTEELAFANSTVTNGDLFANFRAMCNDEISMAISGAIVGHDTKNGSNSKEGKSQDLLSDLTKMDMLITEQQFNEICIPALEKHGIIPPGLSLEFDEIEDLRELWERTKGVLNTHDVDIDWLNKKFSLKVTGTKQIATPQTEEKQKDENLGADPSFFV